SLELKQEGVDVIACPTCGRCQIDMIPLAEEVERRTKHFKTPLKAAVMGCVVNGPGEAMAADIGIAGGDGIGLLFKKGKVVGEVQEHELADLLVSEISKLTGEPVSPDDPLASETSDLEGAPPLGTASSETATDSRIHKVTTGKNRLEGNTAGRGGVLKSEHPDWLPESAKTE
ncbi:MAG: flavodoxin-dependent (E)-4-hydroxy-3-methylbut-2-enyl-diphosphate synthase, partial [Candidatus Zixiibacteriota bacterium]